MQRPPGIETPTRYQPSHPSSYISSPFAAPPRRQTQTSPSSMNAGQGHTPGNPAASNPAGLPGGIGPGNNRGNVMNYPPGTSQSPASSRTALGPSGVGGAFGARSTVNSSGHNNLLFGGAGQAISYPSPQAGGALDLSDFPALGTGAGPTNSQGQGLAASLGGAASRAAAAAGTAVNAAAVNNGFSSDDFPALGAGAVGVGPAPHQFANGSSAQAVAVAAAAAAAAEQASAAAALQHQASQREAHRIGMLSSVNGSPHAADRGLHPNQGLNAARAGFGELDRNYATKPGTMQPSGMPALSTNTAGAQSWSRTGDGGQATSLAPNGSVLTRSPGQPPTTTPASQVLFSPADRFGLAGLLRIIKLQAGGPGAGGADGASADDVGMLALGSDLQSLGLDVGSDHPLHPEFHTPWSSDAHPLQKKQRAMVEPDFHLPSCYNVQPPPPAQTKVANFSDETLFFIFYSTPRDVLQEVAAMELHHRNWRFHKELQLWLTKEHNMEPAQKTPMFEKGQYVFWDVESWQRVTKNFVLLYELLEDRPALATQAQALQQQQLHTTQSVTPNSTPLPAQQHSMQQQQSSQPISVTSGAPQPAGR